MRKNFKGMKLCMDIPMLKLSRKAVLLTRSCGLVHLFGNKSAMISWKEGLFGNKSAMMSRKEGSQFDLNLFQSMRSKASRIQYLFFLDRFVSEVIGVKKWKQNRMSKPFSRYVSISDEAFLLLLHESYNSKWVQEYKIDNQLYNETTDVRPRDVVRKTLYWLHLISNWRVLYV